MLVAHDILAGLERALLRAVDQPHDVLLAYARHYRPSWRLLMPIPIRPKLGLVFAVRLVLFVIGAQWHRVFRQRVIPWLRSKLGRLACAAARDLRKVVRLL